MPFDVQKIARELLQAEDEATEAGLLTDRWPDLGVETAYDIQAAALRLREERGERIVGVKLGLTSPAKQRRMNVDEPLVAWLTDRMTLAPGAKVPVDTLIHPRVEPEIVLEIGAALTGPGLTAEQALRGVRAVRAGLEVIDSRYRDYRFTLPDVVADNASSGYYALAESASAPHGIDLVAEPCRLEKNGRPVSEGVGADVLGDPLNALVFAADLLGRRGIRIEPGWIVLTGGITDAVPVAAGDTVTAHFGSLGTVTVHA
ncbi:fumarylacetoacetate hydrolase family protein [Streptomyces sp. NPDC003077]|uniref:2-keto-4-pentenoate hydratase n=1 Tax=Streptomyces sp. NPDC003077 TaxID=3154443 RepID=UPI0033B7832B